MTRTPERTMRAAALDRFGGTETIRLQTLPVPEVGPDDILIRVETAGVAVWDTFEAQGGFAEMLGTKPKFPYVLGTDGAGAVAAVGNAVRGFKEGERVYAVALANPKGGFYAEYAAVRADYVSRVPDKLTTEQAGVMASDALTALHGLDKRIGLKKGETLMVFGASGGLGHLGLQLAKRIGARVLAVASGDDGVALCRRLGADDVVDGRMGDAAAAAKAFAPNGLDAALLAAGGAAADRALTTMRNGGRVAYPNGVEPEPKVRPGVKLQNYDVVVDREAIERLNSLIESGPFDVHVARTFPLGEAAAALQALGKHFLGKIALRTSAS